MADHRDRIGARLAILLRSKGSPQRGSNSANLGEVSGHELALDRLANAVAGPAYKGCFWIECRQRCKGLIVVAEIDVARITQPLVTLEGRSTFQILPPHLPQLSRRLDRRWPQQDRVDEAEDGRIGGDAQAERYHSHSGEAGVFQQLAEGKAKVVHRFVI